MLHKYLQQNIILAARMVTEIKKVKIYFLFTIFHLQNILTTLFDCASLICSNNFTILNISFKRFINKPNCLFAIFVPIFNASSKYVPFFLTSETKFLDCEFCHCCSKLEKYFRKPIKPTIADVVKNIVDCIFCFEK
ncbi:hypothetical protein DERP_005462 [Dermatophagoides pteronyssinus]|uniref:Uncharacterized protein n=1 Tax=Dermatophagoides pteronyssinus TaxID=6956 RepID=A0ABQ8JMN5_DERPT|nr:hypothetical protein DERP_005462 [Dermatophagoides pteronyssinus]